LGKTQISNTRGLTVQERLQIPGDSADIRARRARDRLAWALVELIQQTDYAAISVQDIAERAQVSRSTFYAHFEDKDDILVRYNVVFGQMLGAQLTWDEAASRYRFPIAHLFEHVQQFRALYDSLSRARKLDGLLKILRINMAQGFEPLIRSRRGECAATLTPVVAHHIASTILSLLVWWMDHHCSTKTSEMDQYFHDLIAGFR